MTARPSSRHSLMMSIRRDSVVWSIAEKNHPTAEPAHPERSRARKNIAEADLTNIRKEACLPCQSGGCGQARIQLVSSGTVYPCPEPKPLPHPHGNNILHTDRKLMITFRRLTKIGNIARLTALQSDKHNRRLEPQKGAHQG